MKHPSVLCFLLALATRGCGGSTFDAQQAGGAGTVGGAGAGAPNNSGGFTAISGGASATGGAWPLGGSNSAGGATQTGGALATGGVAPTGGTKSAGGATQTGGMNPTGGVTSTTTKSPTGGFSPTGGAYATGGKANTGGATSADPQCPAKLPGAGTSCGTDSLSCSYDYFTGCLCASSVYPCVRVDPNCTAATTAAPAAPSTQADVALSIGGAAGIAIPPNRTCTCASHAWTCLS